MLEKEDNSGLINCEGLTLQDTEGWVVSGYLKGKSDSGDLKVYKTSEVSWFEEIKIALVGLSGYRSWVVLSEREIPSIIKDELLDTLDKKLKEIEDIQELIERFNKPIEGRVDEVCTRNIGYLC